jgi:hypothetical protein
LRNHFWGRLGLLLAALALASLPAKGQGKTIFVNDVRVHMETPWPDSVNKGYQPLMLELENTRNREAVVSMHLTGGREDNLRISRTIGLGAGELRRLELLVPAYVQGARDYGVQWTSGGDRKSAWGLGSTGEVGAGTHSLAVFTGQIEGRGRDTRWASELSPAAVTTTTGTYRYYQRIPWRNSGLSGEGVWKDRGVVKVAEIDYALMSSKWESYSSLDLAIVEVDTGLPSQAELSALLAWVRMGGVVVFSGRDANQALAGMDEARDWVEDRFLIGTSDSGPRGIRSYQFGFGHLLVHTDTGLLDNESVQTAVLAELRNPLRTDWTPSPRGSRGSGESLAPGIDGVGALPYRMFVTMMVIFALLVGPLNFMYMRRKGTPARLLVSIPLLAAVCSVAILAYGFLWQGVSVRADSHTVSLLDQRSGLVSATNTRSVFAGIAPGRGLVPGQGTGIFPLGIDIVNREKAIYRVEQEAATSYSASFMPSRVQIRQAVLTSRTSHLRLDMTTVVGGLQVQNALDVEVTDLLVHNKDGKWYALQGESLKAGGSTTLAAISGPPAPSKPIWFTREAEQLWTFHGTDMPELPRGTYSANLTRDPFVDDCGVEVTEIGGSHGLLGVMGESL